MGVNMLISFEVYTELSGWTRIEEAPEGCLDRYGIRQGNSWNIIRNNWLMFHLGHIDKTVASPLNLSVDTVSEFAEYTDLEIDWEVISLETLAAYDWHRHPKYDYNEVSYYYIKKVYVECMKKVAAGRPARIVVGWNI